MSRGAVRAGGQADTRIERRAVAHGWSKLLITIVALVTVAVWCPPAARSQSECRPTRPDALGPFYEPNAPERAKTGEGLVVSGVVRSAKGCGALGRATLEWWSANSRGDYDREHRATHVADDGGRFRYETDFPGQYPGRPPHLHVKVTAPGHRPLVTQLYPKPRETAISFDFVLLPQ
jgi:protocatechuate 3,4-dioxygenase beta subunit